MGSTGFVTLGCDPTIVDATAKFDLGSLALVDGNFYEYVLAGAAIGQGEGVVIDENGSATLDVYSASLPAKVGIAQVAIASGSYGWVLRMGKGVVKVLTLCAADVKIYTTATAGVYDDTSTTQSLIVGLRLDAAQGAGTGLQPCSATTFLYHST